MTSLSHLPKWQLLLISLAGSAVLIAVLCTLYPPTWETNDDVAMSMLAHGYGVAHTGSPNILFSNVLWGHFVRQLPAMGSVIGYSIATMGVLLLVGAVMLYCCARGGVSVITLATLTCFVLLRPIIFPQFTINAGLLMVVAVMCWWRYASDGETPWVLTAALGLSFVSYLIRAPEFFLVFLVASPLIPWRKLMTKPYARCGVVGLCALLALAFFVDFRAYQALEWREFNDLNPVRAPFTDFGAGASLRKSPELLVKQGYSINDIELLENWFFADPKIADPSSLRILLDSSSGGEHVAQQRLLNVKSAFRALFSPWLLPMLAAALLLAILRPTRGIANAWFVFLLAILAMGLIGRPGLMRVYIPPLSLLLVAPLLAQPLQGGKWKSRAGEVVLLIALIAHAYFLLPEVKKAQEDNAETRKALGSFPDTPVVIWGDTFPYEAIYPVLNSAPEAMRYKHYGLGVSTLAPYTVAASERAAGRSLPEALIQTNGILIMAAPKHLEMLGKYCREHLEGELQKLSTFHHADSRRFGLLAIYQYRCKTGM